MNIRDAKKLDLVDYLTRLGFKPQRVSGNQYWYHSPLHDEKTPSFKVNRLMNKWYDFGEGKGGNIIDFGVAFHKQTVSDFLHRLDGPGQKPVTHHQKSSKAAQEQEDSIKINAVKPIHSLPLIKYLRDRRIPLPLAQQFLQEVNYSLRDKNYYALGFRNDQGGYELRNQYIKASSSPKASTFIDQEADRVAVFEGFFDFLSHKAITDAQTQQSTNYLILNSASFFEQQLPRMQQHQQVNLFLDNDTTGNKMTAAALALDPNRFNDQRELYKDYNDLNAWCQHQGKSVRMQQKP
ncbi:toprim domain-containing protein [Paraflavitalea sp. CAU 1676]|uniref:toprim domain-containing protein n=1 Tax=Paraflavitalea sp. CAU 1676 TaxID=3032598 RepID=UPI0023DCC03B|nr:toprim domain-containing protein [Paraflavitalea sp. CAU 1676]MDF2188678.1 toprim domain-containing protein [Paraflavitalea sp. CAU 1676]